MYPRNFQKNFSTFSMHTSQSTNKMAANHACPKLTMYRRFFNVNTGNAIKIFDAGG